MLTAQLETLAIAGADRLMTHAETAARRRGLALCFAVVDNAGQLRAFLTAPEAMIRETVDEKGRHGESYQAMRVHRSTAREYHLLG